jgi:hypothetical protein
MQAVKFVVPFLLTVVFSSYSALAFSLKCTKQPPRLFIFELEAKPEANRNAEVRSFPESPKHLIGRDVSKRLRSALLALPVGFVTLNSRATEACATDEEKYEDKSSGFSIDLPPGWLPLPRKTPTPTMMKYQTEEVLFVANNFAEGSSLSVTRCNAGRLLKDFEIEWWFAPLEKMEDVGSADLISRLLILQRQGEFEKKETPSIATNTKIDNDILTFEFSTPLAEEVTRKTIAKCFFRSGTLLVVWVSALSSVWDGDYASKLNSLRDSFKLTR